MERLSAAVAQDGTVLPRALRVRDVRRAVQRLEGTYLIRLFAEFETGLRLYWATARRTEPPARTRDLLEGLAATRRISHDARENAQTVREYRNHSCTSATSPSNP